MNITQTLRSVFELGRVSNLPTVWSNTLVGITLGGGAGLLDTNLPVLLVVFSLFYTGGMFLNDACDREFDARHRPERPIPAGRIRAGTVFLAGFALLGLALLLLFATTLADPRTSVWPATFSGLALVLAIVVYDFFHKDNRWAPLLMGLARVLIYLTAAFAVAGTIDDVQLVIAVGILFAWVIGLTGAARGEHQGGPTGLWPLALLAIAPVYGLIMTWQIPLVWPFLVLLIATLLYALRLLKRAGPHHRQHAIMLLIAGIALVDAVILAAAGAAVTASAAVAAFLLTLMLQRYVAGT